MQELLKTCPRLLPLPVHEFLAILSLVCHIRLHVSRLAFRHLEHKIPCAIVRCTDIAHLQAKSHTAEGSLLAKLGHGVTTLEQAGFYYLGRLRGSQLSQGGASTHLCSPLLHLLPCQFHTFLRSEFLRDTVLRSAECLNRRWTDRGSLENIVRAILP